MSYTSFLNKKHIIKEGGAFGSVLYPYSDENLTIQEFKKILFALTDGSISKFKNCEIKSDGQGFFVSMKDNQVIFSRANKHHKSNGENALKSPEDVKNYMPKLPDEVSDSFKFAAEDLTSCLSRLDKTFTSQIFQSGKRWLSLEILNNTTYNVLQYSNTKRLYLHTIVTVADNSGTLIDDNRQLAKTLYDQIEKAGLNNQKTFVIIPSIKAVFNPNPNEKQDKENIQKYLDKFLLEYPDVKETDKIETYQKSWWQRYIKDNSLFELEEDEMEVLVDRFLENKVDLSLNNFRQVYGKQLEQWIKSVDDLSKSLNYTCLDPLRYIHDEISFLAINRLKTGLSTDPQKTRGLFKKDFQEKIKWVKSLPKTDKNYEKFNRYFIDLTKHKKIDEIEISEEGVVYFYKNNLYKSTGFFGFINQLYGIGKYNNR